VSLLNVAVFFTVYSGGPTADDIHDDAVVPAAAGISNLNSIPTFAAIHTVLAVLWKNNFRFACKFINFRQESKIFDKLLNLQYVARKIYKQTQNTTV
jgi:hypothetical protein